MKFEPSDYDSLKPLLEEVARATVDAMAATNAKLPAGRLGFSEAEAAELLGLARHRLRDARIRGEISARLVGKGYIYSAESLRRFVGETQ